MAVTVEDLVDVINIAKDIDDDKLKVIGGEIVDRYDDDKMSRGDWERKHDDILKLAMQVKEIKSSPWPGAANVKYPLVTTAAINFSSSMYPAVIKTPNLVKSVVIGEDREGKKSESAARIEKHMSYQTLYQMNGWETDMDKGFTVLPTSGCFFKKTYFSHNKGMPASDLILPRDLVVNYWASNIEDAYSKTHVFEKGKNEIVGLMNLGVYREFDIAQESSERIDRSLSDERQGMSEVPTTSAPYLIIECHTWYDLDNDGYEEPYIITVLYDTKQVLRITARYDRDSVFFDDKGKVLSITPIEYFTKYGFIPSPDGGFYDLSYGSLLSPLNNTINSSINQLLDSGTFYNSGGGFLSSNLKMKKGEIRIKPGQFVDVNATIDDISKGIMLIPAREPSNVTLSLLSMMIDAGQRMSATTDLFVGGNAASNEKATTTEIRQEQGMKVFNGITKRTHQSLNNELRKLFRINSVYLDEQGYFNVLDFNEENGDVEAIFRADYNTQNVDVLPASDANATAQQQRIAKAESLLPLVQMGTINPQIATREILDANEYPNVEELMQVQEQAEDPKIALEKQRVQLQAVQAAENAAIKAQSEDTKTMLAQTQGILNLAKAEAAEKGKQMDSLRAELESIKLLSAAQQRIMEEAAKVGQEPPAPQEQQGQQVEPTNPEAI
jgi:chaperonin GroES